MKKLILYFIAAIILQMICLVIFIEISSSPFAVYGKPLVILCSIICMLALIWLCVISYRRNIELFLLPMFLAFGYSIAFHLVGLIFHGLLRDCDLSIDYIKSVLAVTSMMLLLYTICTLLLYLLKQRIRPRWRPLTKHK